MRIVGMVAALVSALAFVSAFDKSAAEAATITQTIGFTASGFTAQNGSAVPRDPIKGNFTFTLDNSKSVTDVSSGLYFHALNMKTIKPIVFSYDATQKLLTVGANAHANQYVWGTNDFTLSILLDSQPRGAFFGYSLRGHNDSYETYNIALVTRSPSGAQVAAVSSTPLPGSVLMLMSALGMLVVAACLRRRALGSLPA